MSKHLPFRYDFVGSFLRPEALKRARAQFAAGKISAAQLKEAEDEAIAALVEKQKRAGYAVITDGEFRRAAWHLDFMWAFKGVGHAPTRTGLPFHGEAAMIDDTYLTGKVSIEGVHPFVEHFAYLKQFEDADTAAKQTIPSPAQFLLQMIMPLNSRGTAEIYAHTQELADDIVAGYKKVIADLYAAGCRNLQLDDCTWGMLVNPAACAIFDTDQKGVRELCELFVHINNRALEEKPRDLTTAIHVCRGNYHSAWASSGAYDAVADTLLGKHDVDAFYLEFDDARSGGFEPLKAVPDGKRVVLGLITTKSCLLEDSQKIKDRVAEAAKYVPLERLCLSPQCGFASCEIGNRLTEAQQWQKLALVKQIAQEIWG